MSTPGFYHHYCKEIRVGSWFNYTTSFHIKPVRMTLFTSQLLSCVGKKPKGPLYRPSVQSLALIFQVSHSY